MPPLTGPLVAAGGGRPSFQPWLDGRRLDDVVGDRWLAVTRGHDGPAGEWWRERGALVLSACDHPALEALLDAAVAPDGTIADAVVVRPDRYVLGGAPGLAELATLAAACLPA
jgi:hypothetical protein